MTSEYDVISAERARPEIRRVDMRRWATDGHGVMQAPGEPKAPFEEPMGPMHWKPGSMTADGAMCGRTGVRFTARIEEVACGECIDLMPTT